MYVCMYNQFRLVQNSTCDRPSKCNYCVSRGVSVTEEKGGGGGERERELLGQNELKGKMFVTVHMHLMLLPLSNPTCELSMPGYSYHELLRM